MTYTINLEIHEAILEDDKSIAELVRNEVKKQTKVEENVSLWLGFKDLFDIVYVEPYNLDRFHELNDLLHLRRIKSSTSEFEAPNMLLAMEKAARIMN